MMIDNFEKHIVCNKIYRLIGSMGSGIAFGFYVVADQDMDAAEPLSKHNGIANYAIAKDGMSLIVVASPEDQAAFEQFPGLIDYIIANISDLETMMYPPSKMEVVVQPSLHCAGAPFMIPRKIEL